jgi:glycosyltransferase involved in cell wall biosynthesis
MNSVESIGIRITDKLNVGYTGHLYSGKGMEIINDLVTECQFAHFHIVGGKESDVKYWSEKLVDYQNITFYGFKMHSEIPSYLKDFDIVLLPNQKEVKSNRNMDIGKWTSPLKLFEYMAAGKAIVASDIPVLNEILINGVNSYTCSPSNANEWIEKLEELGNNANKREIIGQGALNDFILNYSWEKRAQKLISALN